MKKGYKSLNAFFSNILFLGAFFNYKDLPNLEIPEICFIGRSNVGKSSLINKLTKKNIAKTSKTPGRTRSLNLFTINNKVILMDLPGYGFAKFSKEIKKKLLISVRDYMEKRKNLKHIFILVDSKIGMKSGDYETILFLSEIDVSFSIILTKKDKSTKKNLDKIKKEILEILMKINHNKNIHIHSISAKNNDGISDIQKKIFNMSLS